MLKQVLKQSGIPTEFAYEGFLYGHYDSRGGTTFVVAKTKQEADLRYLREVCGEENATEADVTGPIEDQSGWLADYLGAATLHSTVPLTEAGDLEDDDKATVFAWGNVPAAGDEGWEECHRSGEPLWSFISDWFTGADGDTKLKKRLIYSPDGTKPNDKAFRVRWEDDAYSFMFMPAKSEDKTA